MRKLDILESLERYDINQETGCWEWRLAKDRCGYGKMKFRGESKQAHRMSYQEHVGDIPDGSLVMHSCDNPPCINPGHLFIGSHRDNMADMTSKRRRHGELCPSAKLSEVDVMNIRAILKCIKRRGVKAELSRIYGVSDTAICRIDSGYSWA